MGLYLGHDKVANGGFIGDYDSLPVGSVIEYDGNEVPDGYEKVDDIKENEYSAEEIIIGKWFGKPLYRKIVQATLPSTTSSWTVIANLGVNNIENIINFRGWFSWGGDQFFVLPMAEGGYFINLRMTKSGNIECIRNGWDALPAHIIVEYTKTTD